MMNQALSNLDKNQTPTKIVDRLHAALSQALESYIASRKKLNNTRQAQVETCQKVLNTKYYSAIALRHAMLAVINQMPYNLVTTLMRINPNNLRQRLVSTLRCDEFSEKQLSMTENSELIHANAKLTLELQILSERVSTQECKQSRQSQQQGTELSSLHTRITRLQSALRQSKSLTRSLEMRLEKTDLAYQQLQADYAKLQQQNDELRLERDHYHHALMHGLDETSDSSTQSPRSLSY